MNTKSVLWKKETYWQSLHFASYHTGFIRANCAAGEQSHESRKTQGMVRKAQSPSRPTWGIKSLQQTTD
jgi:hypothetical protein